MAEWKTGDVITAERLNGMQKEPLIIHQNFEGTIATLDKTFKQIKDAFASGVCCVFDASDEYDPVNISTLISIHGNGEQFSVYFNLNNHIYTYSCSGENNYPYCDYA